MRRDQMNRELIEQVCCGDREAMDWLGECWSPYAHAIDDIIDGDRQSPEDILETFALAAMVYSHPFFLKHVTALRAVALVITNMYADAVAWEKSAVGWQAEWADHARHAGMEMVIAVAQICGGYSHARAWSLEQRVGCYHEHHDGNGKPN